MSLPTVVIVDATATAPAESVLDCPNRYSGEGKFLTGVRNRISDEREPKHGAGGVKRSTVRGSSFISTVVL